MTHEVMLDWTHDGRVSAPLASRERSPWNAWGNAKPKDLPQYSLYKTESKGSTWLLFIRLRKRHVFYELQELGDEYPGIPRRHRERRRGRRKSEVVKRAQVWAEQWALEDLQLIAREAPCMDGMQSA